MGCGGYSKVNKSEVNGAVYRKITREDIHVDVGEKAHVSHDGPIIIFVYGGPGSKKGRLVSELVEVFDFTFVNVEKIMLQKMAEPPVRADETEEKHEEAAEGEQSSGASPATSGTGEPTSSTLKSGSSEEKASSSQDHGDHDKMATQKKEAKYARKESIQELKKVLEEDPTAVSLRWILRQVSSEVEKNPNGRYLIDMIPNLKYIIRTANFSSDCSNIMAEFEDKHPVSFSVYFSLSMGTKSKSQPVKVEEVKEDREEDHAGFQSCEVDLSRTKRRASMFENSVRCFLDYFRNSERLITVDVSCRNANAISSKVCDVLSRLSLKNLKLVNTVLIFVFDSKGLDPDDLQQQEVDLIRLEKEGCRLSIASLDDAIHSFVTNLNHKEHKTFMIDLSSTNITKNTDVEVPKSSIVFVNDANMDRHFDIPGCHGLFKSVSSLENAICVFPEDTNVNLCKRIAVAFNTEFSNPRGAS